VVFFGLIENYARLLALFVTLESRASVTLPDDWSEMGPRCVTGVKLLSSTVLWRLPARLYKNHKSFDSHSYQITNHSTADEELVRAVMLIRRACSQHAMVGKRDFTPPYGTCKLCVTDIDEMTQLFWYCQVSSNGWPTAWCTSYIEGAMLPELLIC